MFGFQNYKWLKTYRNIENIRHFEMTNAVLPINSLDRDFLPKRVLQILLKPNLAVGRYRSHKRTFLSIIHPVREQLQPFLYRLNNGQYTFIV